jgi:hypothetical protein
MQWQLVLALAVVIPVILFPAAFVWFLNITGLLQVMKEARTRERRRAKAHRDALAIK